MASGPLLLFDGDCAFCTSSVGWFVRAFPHAFVALPYQRAKLELLGLTESECHSRLQWISDTSMAATSRESGARAVGSMMRSGGRSLRASAVDRDSTPPVDAHPRAATRSRLRLRASGALWIVCGVLALVPPTSWIAAGIYWAVAANRHALPGGTPACHL